MNEIIFWTIFTAVAAGFFLTCIIEAVSTAIKKRKHGKRITIKPYPNPYGWIIVFGVLQGLNAGLAVYSLVQTLKYRDFTRNFLNSIVLDSIKIVCYLILMCACIIAYFLRTRSYLTESGIVSDNSFFPVKSVKYSVETVGDEYMINLYTKKPKPSYTYLVKNKEALSMLENHYEKADGNATDVKIKRGTVKYLLTLLCTSLIFVGGIFAWYETQKPFIFVKDVIVPTDAEWAIFSDVGYVDLLVSDRSNYYDELNGKYREVMAYDYQNLTPEDITVLKELPNLKHLEVMASDIDDLTTIGELTQLEGLAIGGDDMFAKPTDYSPLKNLTKLKYFIGYGLYNFNDMTVFENADDLAYLELTYADIQSGLDVIGEKKNLLDLEMFSCTADDFSPIGNCTNLKRLLISNTNVTDLSFLENLTNLEYLVISNTNAEDYSVLLELPSLKKVSAINCGIPDEIIEKLTERGIENYCETED